MKRFLVSLCLILMTASVFAEFTQLSENHAIFQETNKEFSDIGGIKSVSYCHAFYEAQEFLTIDDRHLSYQSEGNLENIEVGEGKYPDIEAQHFRYKVIELNKDCLPFVAFIIDSSNDTLWVAKEMY